VAEVHDADTAPSLRDVHHATSPMIVHCALTAKTGECNELDACTGTDTRRQTSCDALDLIIVPRVRDLGGFSVHRALPHAKRQMVGPFIFFDQMGPVQLIAGQGMDVRPHPHIGLATVTYLFDGRVVHRDSEGNALEITPGAMNLMTAGRGIAHSECSPLSARQGTECLFGIQSWIALPEAYEETDPSFQHFDAASLPTFEDAGVRARVIAGSAFGKTSPVGMLSECSTQKCRSPRARARRLIATRRSGQFMWSRERSRSRARHSRGRGFWSFIRAAVSRCGQRARRV
jgi:redox-sensitive bicupin YhaK (pirin superfamily)